MAYNNTVILTGNIGAEATVHDQGKRPFATTPLATTDSYKNEAGEWVNKDTLWHNLIVFSPMVVSAIQALKKGTRIKVTGSLSYRSFETTLEDGSTANRQAASIIVHKFELAPLAKRS